jgi:HK97 gp10 family phage protein
MATTTTTTKGLAELHAALNTLPATVERNILRSAMRQGGNVFMKKARENLATGGSVDTGVLRKGIKVSTSAKGGTVIAKVRATGEHAYIAHWIESGVQAHSIKKGADASSGHRPSDNPHPGFRAKPFMRPALDTEMQAAIAAVGNSIKKTLATKHGINTPQPETKAP